MKPLTKDEIIKHLAKIDIDQGSSNYFHLNEETGQLTTYSQQECGEYKRVLVDDLPLVSLRRLTLAYEERCGFDLKKLIVGSCEYSGLVESFRPAIY